MASRGEIFLEYHMTIRNPINDELQIAKMARPFVWSTLLHMLFRATRFGWVSTGQNGRESMWSKSNNPPYISNFLPANPKAIDDRWMSRNVGSVFYIFFNKCSWLTGCFLIVCDLDSDEAWTGTYDVNINLEVTPGAAPDSVVKMNISVHRTCMKNDTSSASTATGTSVEGSSTESPSGTVETTEPWSNSTMEGNSTEPIGNTTTESTTTTPWFP